MTMEARISWLEKASWVIKQNTLFYLSRSGIKPEDLNNKKVLVIGAGGGDLERDLKNAGINVNCRITNVDLQYDPRRRSQFWRLILKLPRQDYPQNAIWADAKHLPFADGSFDIAFAFNSINPYILASAKRQAIAEASRVSSNVYIYPASSLGLDNNTLHIGKNNRTEIVS